jgi:hypothetical protein
MVSAGHHDQLGRDAGGGERAVPGLSLPDERAAPGVRQEHRRPDTARGPPETQRPIAGSPTAFADCSDALNHLTGEPIGVFSGFVSGFGVDASWGRAIPHVYSSSSHTARASATHFWGTGPCSEASSSDSSASKPNSGCLRSAVSSESCPAGSTLTKLRYRGKQDVSKPRSLSAGWGRIRRVRRGTSGGYVRLTGAGLGRNDRASQHPSAH